MNHILGHTQTYGILGDPVAHSLSPLFQNYFLAQAKLDACYIPFLVKPKLIQQALLGLHAANIQGLNITIPHKEAILDCVDADSDATTIGAVNTLRRTEHGWQATNTDWIGFSSVMEGLQVQVSNTPVLLFGAGGTSRAILHALHHQGAKHVFLCNRNQARAQQLIQALKRSYPDMKVSILAWEQTHVASIVSQSQLVINSTSIGLNDNDSFPFELPGQGVAIDAVYKPHGNTAFCRITGNRYISTDGLPMLIAQGVASFAYWFEPSITTNPNILPDTRLALQWVEQQLGRTPIDMLGWRT